MPTVKVHAFLARKVGVSRRKAEERVAQGKVRVNGKVAHVGQRIDPKNDEVIFEGKRVLTHRNDELVYILVNKHRGVVSTTSDELGRKTVLSLVSDIKTRMYPVGRLDKDSEGLMLLTNDGDLAYRLTHPKFRIIKTYEVLVTGKPTQKALNRLRQGVKLKDGITSPAKVEILKELKNSTWISISISEGKNRQVRRMLGRVGHEVLRLNRVKLGPFSLDDLNGKRIKYLDPKNLPPLTK